MSIRLSIQVVCFGHKKKAYPRILYNDSVLEVVDQYKYLGLLTHRLSRCKSKCIYDELLRKAKSRMHCAWTLGCRDGILSPFFM